jgi:hypothetical protein
MGSSSCGDSDPARKSGTVTLDEDENIRGDHRCVRSVGDS